VSVTVRCTTHPKYKAKQKPRVKCDACKAIWSLKNKGLIE